MKRITVKALTGAMTMAMLFGAAVIANPDTASAKVKVSKVTVKSPAGSKKKAYVAKGKKISLSTTVSVKPNKSKNKKVTYKSANKKIATVSAKGVVTGKKAGTTKITVTSKQNKKKKATIKVTVKKAAVKKVKLSAKTATLAVNGKKTLKATVTPTKNTYTKVGWKSSNKKVATVSSKGVVTGKKEGTATITATALDGSKKKATCKVTVGAGISTVSVPHYKIVRVSLSSAKELKAEDITVQNKESQNGQYTTSETVEGITTTDNKNYDVQLDGNSSIAENSWVKVTISSLSVDKTKEIYVSNIAGYGLNGNERISYMTGYKVGETYDAELSAYNNNSVGEVKITNVEGLPNGLKSYISKEGRIAKVKGVFGQVENGTTLTVTGVDEEGTTCVHKYIFFVGDDTHLVGYTLDRTDVAYTPDNEQTPKNEACGYDISYADPEELPYGYGVSGGSGSYTYKLAGLDPRLGTVDEEDGGFNPAIDAQGKRVAVPAGDYPMTLVITDSSNSSLSVSVPFTLKLVEGVTVKGTVKDAAGAPARDVYVRGYTKTDAYGVYHSLSTVRTDSTGTYETRVVPGDYCTYVSWNTSYNTTVGNDFTSGVVTKDFTLPLFYVTFNTNAPNAKAYSSPSVKVIDAYGDETSLDVNERSYESDYGTMYAYLKAGSYEVVPSKAESSANTVYAYGKLDTFTDSLTNMTYYYRDYESGIGRFKLSGSFSVAGNTNVTLNATQYADD